MGKVKAVRFSQLGDFDSLITERGQSLRPLIE
jgi:DeoR family deoxyribose operon repressor